MASARHLLSGLFASLVACGVAACGGDASPGDTPTLTELDKTIFAPRCTGPCHSGGEFAAGGLDLKPDLHAALMNAPVTAPACAGKGLTRVVEGDPEASLLYRKVLSKIDGTAPPCGDTMPLGIDAPALPDSDVELIRAWIAGGAIND